MATSYAAGRLAQLDAGEFTYRVYRHSGAEHPRLDHKSWDRVVLPTEHPFWAQHYPPNGWGCGCKVYGAHSVEGARRRGGDPDKPLPDNWDQVDPRTGAQRGIGKGWGYAPGASVLQTVQLGADIIRRQPAEIGSLLGADLAPMVARAWPMWLADTMARGSHREGLVGTMLPRLVDLLGRSGVAPASAEILLKPGLIVGPKARRHEDKGDALSLAEWLMLPKLMLEPQRSLLDTQSGKVLLLLGTDTSAMQLALDLTYRRRGGDQALQNVIVSAYHPNERDLLGRLANRQIIDLEDGDAG